MYIFLHVADAASAAVAALERGAPGIYNVVDDEPAPQPEGLPGLPPALGADPPRAGGAPPRRGRGGPAGGGGPPPPPRGGPPTRRGRRPPPPRRTARRCRCAAPPT